jgi:hypothetical protein
MGNLPESGTGRLRPAARRIAGVFLLAAVLLGGCNVLGVILLSGCLDSDEYLDRTLYYKSQRFDFICNKEISGYYEVYNQAGTLVLGGPVPDGSCVYALALAQSRLGFVPSGASNSSGGPANRSAAAGTRLPANLVYILDVENYFAVQIMDPSNAALTEVDLPGGAKAAYPVGMDMTPDGKSLWVAQIAIQQNGGGVPPQPPQISIMDTASQGFTGSFALPAGISPNTLLFSPDGTTAYVSNDGAQFQGESGVPANSSVLVINVASHAVVNTIATPKGAGPAVLTPDGLLLYTVENTNGVGGNALTVIDTTTNTVATSVSLPNGAIKLFINPSGTRLYIFWPRGILVFDTAINQQVASIPTVGFSTANNWAAFSQDDQSVWFCNCGFGAYYQVDQRTNQLIQMKQQTGLGVGFMFAMTQ